MSRNLTADQLAAAQPHPLAGLMPPMSDAQYAALRLDIAGNGQRQAITLLDGMILDGRNRARALTSLARGAAVVDLPGSMDPVTYVLSNNVARRQLSTSQSAMIAARLVTTRQGVPVVTGDVTQEQAAARMSVSVRYVRDAQWLVERHPAIADQVFAGSLSLAAAMRQARPAPMPAAPTNPVAPAEVAAPVEAVPADADALLRGILAMEGVDPGEWIHTLPAARRVAVLTMLEDFARRAYDAAEEGGLL